MRLGRANIGERRYACRACRLLVPRCIRIDHIGNDESRLEFSLQDRSLLQEGDEFRIWNADVGHGCEVGEVERAGTLPVDWLGAPLKADGKTFGALVVQTYTEGVNYQEDDQQILDFVSAHVAMAVSRKQAEAERQQLLHQIHLLLDSTDEGIIGVDLQGRCTFANRAAERLLRYSQSEMLNRNMHELSHHHHGDGSVYAASECPITHTLESGRGIRVNTEVFWRKDGSAVPVEYASRPIVENYLVSGSVITFVDITERKWAEEQLR